MRISLVFALLLLIVAPGVAQDAGGVTAQVPENSPVSVRVKSLERVDAVAKEWVPILKAFGLEEAANLEHIPLSNMLFAMSGLSADLVDKTKPVVLAMAGDEEPVVILHGAEGVTWEGGKTLNDGLVAVQRGGAVLVGRAKSLEMKGRAAPTKFLDGDISFHVYLGDLVAKHKDEIEQGAAEAAMQAGGAPGLPDGAKALVLPMVSAVKEAVFSVDSFDYALTWKGDRLEAEGLLSVKERTGMRAFLARCGKPGGAELAAYMPKDALLTFTGNITADWPVKEFGAMLDAAVGEEGAGAPFQQLLSMSAAFTDQLTGRSAGAMSLAGMLGVNMVSIYELKEGADPAKLRDALDAEKLNAAMKKFGLPITYTIEKAVAKHGETELHRMAMGAEDPNIAMMLAMYQYYFAAENGYMFVAMSATGEDDLKELIDLVRAGKKVEHPHMEAMGRLGAHNFGFTLNLGALKPMAMMLQMVPFVPQEAIQAINNLPDDLPLSTAVTLGDGNIHWRGDFPVQELAKVAAAITGAKKKAAPQEEDEDY